MRVSANSSIFAAFCLIGLVVFFGGAAASNKTASVPGTRYLSTDELWLIYHNRSWVWSDGAGYFRNSKRSFSAFAGGGKDASYAEGIWYLSDPGKACFRATWIGADYSERKLTCFSHRADGKVVYQRRLPDGDWYVFKSHPVIDSDEIKKLLPGDYAAEGLQRNKQAISR